MTAAVEDVAEVLLLLVVERARLAVRQKLGESDDAVQRRAKFVGHAGQEAVLGLIGALELDVLLLQRALDALAIRDVADRAHHQRAAVRLQRAEADLDRELAAVLAQS